MKGLLIKDFIMTWKYCKAFVFLMALFLIGSVFVTVNSFMTVYPMVLSSMLPFSVCAYDERIKWNVYCDALPISRKKVVLTKYVFALICILAVTVCATAAMYVKMLIHEQVDLKEMPSMVALLLSVALVSPGFMLPFVFKYNVEKARIAYYVTIGAVCAVSVIFSSDAGLSDIPVYMVLIAAVLFYCISCFVSVKLYEKREL